MSILPKKRDPRLTTIRRGGTLNDEQHRLLADRALARAEHVLPCTRIIDPATSAALSAGQAVAVADVAAHDLGAAAYAVCWRSDD